MWGRILGLAWLKFTLAPLQSQHSEHTHTLRGVPLGLEITSSPKFNFDDSVKFKLIGCWADSWNIC